MSEPNPPPAGPVGTKGVAKPSDLGLDKTVQENIFGPPIVANPEPQKAHYDNPADPKGEKLTADQLRKVTNASSTPVRDRSKDVAELQRLTAEIVKLGEESTLLDATAVTGLVDAVNKAKKTVARASQLRRRPADDITYPTHRLDPKLNDTEAQQSVADAARNTLTS